MKRFGHRFHTMRWLVLGYLAVTLIAAAVLSLPISSRTNTPQRYLDSVFVAASGISTSGLTVVDIGSYYSLFGQITLLILFQIGGIGYMSIVYFFVAMAGIKTRLSVNIIAIDSISGANLHEIKPFFVFLIVYTTICETIGAIALTLVFMREQPLDAAVYSGIFHSVSAFCTAGFSIHADSLMRYRFDVTVNIVINLVSLLGGLGFFVCFDLVRYLHNSLQRPRRPILSLHSKIILVFTPIIIVATTLIVFVSEKWGPDTGTGERVAASLFQTISASTTDGFNTLDIGAMNDTSLLTIMVLMFTGAAPGSTGGGIKLSTLVVILLFLAHQLADRDDNVTLFRRRIATKTIRKAFGVFSWFVIIMTIDAAILLKTETGGFTRILFEIVSALGNTGLSTGITSSLTDIGRFILSVTMFIGRVGPLAFGVALVGESRIPVYELPEEEVLVG